MKIAHQTTASASSIKKWLETMRPKFYELIAKTIKIMYSVCLYICSTYHWDVMPFGSAGWSSLRECKRISVTSLCIKYFIKVRWFCWMLIRLVGLCKSDRKIDKTTSEGRQKRKREKFVIAHKWFISYKIRLLTTATTFKCNFVCMNLILFVVLL